MDGLKKGYIYVGVSFSPHPPCGHLLPGGEGLRQYRPYGFFSRPPGKAPWPGEKALGLYRASGSTSV